MGSLTRREFLTRSGLLVAATAVGPPILAACAGGDLSTLERVRRDGVVRVGFASERPYGYIDDDGRLTGIGPEVARAVLSRMGIERMDGIESDFGGLLSDLDSKLSDIVVAGMVVTPDRCEDATFSDPAFCLFEAFAVARDNPRSLRTYEDLLDGDAVLGVLRGDANADYANELELPDERVRTFGDPFDMIDALVARQVDAAALPHIAFGEVLSRGDYSGVEVTEPFVPTVRAERRVRCGSYAFRPDDDDFRAEFNGVLGEMKANDEVLPIVERFGLVAAELEEAKGHTGDGLCLGAEAPR